MSWVDEHLDRQQQVHGSKQPGAPAWSLIGRTFRDPFGNHYVLWFVEDLRAARGDLWLEFEKLGSDGCRRRLADHEVCAWTVLTKAEGAAYEARARGTEPSAPSDPATVESILGPRAPGLPDSKRDWTSLIGRWFIDTGGRSFRLRSVEATRLTDAGGHWLYFDSLDGLSRIDKWPASRVVSWKLMDDPVARPEEQGAGIQKLSLKAPDGPWLGRRGARGRW